MLDCRLPDSDTHFTDATFELGHFYALLKYCKQKRLAVDGGAHVGVWTKAMARYFKEVIAFEPKKENFDCLVENVGQHANVKCFDYALGQDYSMGSIHSPVNPGNSGAGWVVPGGDFDIVPLDSFGLEDADFIKLDVEGFEPFALEGAKKTIEEFHPVILVEQKPITARYGLDYMAAGKLLEGWGYELKEKLNKDYIYAYPEPD